jgi:hypothetical protein
MIVIMSTTLGPIIIHSQNISDINAVEEYFETKCIARIRADECNFYIDFKPMDKSHFRNKLMNFVSSDFVLRHKGEIVRFTHEFYDL